MSSTTTAAASSATGNPPPPPSPPLLNHAELVSTITTFLRNSEPATSALQAALSPYLPYLTPPVIHSILSSPTLHHHPSTLLSFLNWANSHSSLKPCTPLPLAPLLSLLSSLISRHKFRDAKSLLQSQILSEHPHHQLHRHLLHPSPPLPPPSKSLLDTCISAYCRSGGPHLAAQIFKKMKRLKLRPNLLTLNTLLSSLEEKLQSGLQLYDDKSQLIFHVLRLGKTSREF